MGRAQCIVHRENRLLMVKHRQDGKEWWCLPGGGIEQGETPVEAAVRELREECGVVGTIVPEVSAFASSPQVSYYTFLVDIGNQEPRLGTDPEFGGESQLLVEVKWLTLAEVPERDRAFLWAAGLLAVEEFADEVISWGDSISYPQSGAR
ncbi:MAG TPA: NUDIX hydrolase [Dehalococcoidales bacterium]|nr:NUDIX hydrolase [Dehalococcoidales bacterium]